MFAATQRFTRKINKYLNLSRSELKVAVQTGGKLGLRSYLGRAEQLVHQSLKMTVSAMARSGPRQSGANLRANRLQIPFLAPL